MFKKILSALIVAIVLGGTVFAFAYWDNLQKTQGETINIGQGVTLELAVVAAAPAGHKLVPTGVILKTNDVTSVVLTYNVKLDVAVITALGLTVTSSNILIGGSAANSGLVTVGISLGATTVNSSNVLVTVTVTLAQPADVATYDLIKNQPITFTLTFTAA